MITVQAALKRQQFTLDVDFNIASTITGLFGPSGSGKSTLISIIAGLTKPDRGRIVVNNTCLFDSAKRIDVAIHQRRIGLVFQDSRLFPHLNVQNNLKFGITKEAKLPFSFDEMAEQLAIDHLLKQKPHQLSGGEKQRVAIGRALLSAPQLLLLDEPLASLDDELKSQILPFLKQTAETMNIPMIYISHALEEVSQMTDDIVHIQHGNIVSSTV